ncbi:heme lyase CcmF/NrfE family subunit [Enterovibrio sp. ZSDZ35]|uniref:Heme lyase CcmF/NrfE family subunit n=1 Tax=Enterovibrio qingdaonensis TaxID=2899818 RepID=A0ABT5QFY3_9GAMM|nr:heme lyase CcmF/NrfE family subunit [Enterovibrio sp. ZSDZ35]MDD1779890.1 heme lyase CcmF/NrfE family subunit [Enterovibrio sp. ZSDZ35]
MLAELGHFLFILGIASSCTAGLLALLPARVLNSTDTIIEDFPAILSITAFVSMLMATLLLAYCFYADDFSVRYVAQHSNSALPIPFKLAAVWGGHEGSFLFMVLTLSGWTAIISTRLRDFSRAFRKANLATLCGLLSMLGIYCLFLSNPFLRDPTFPTAGRDLNPMLQDVGLIIHPPLLYLGYIGFAVPFSLSIAGIAAPIAIKKWAAVCRVWVSAAWAFLTAGIAVGAWWAYNELGWGGWWFWDPVENASLLPWLTATALLHCLIVTEKKQTLLPWSLLLAIVTFSLSILGTFIVRSGVLTSVHAFASDPMRGTGLLIIFTLVLIPALVFYAIRGPRLFVLQKSPTQIDSLSFFMLGAAGFLVSMMLIVMLGTFYPLIYNALGLGTLSVGAPYFNSLFVPLTLACAILAGSALLLRRKKHTILAIFLLSTGCGWAASIYLAKAYNTALSPLAMLSFSCAFFLVLTAVHSTLTHTMRAKAFPMLLGHSGFAVAIVGATMLSTYSEELSLKMREGDRTVVGEYSVTHAGSSWHIGPNYTAERISFSLKTETKSSFSVAAEKRHYTVRTMNMSEAGIYGDGFNDIYITLGTKFDATTYAVRIQIKPGIPFLWLGACLMAMAGLSVVLGQVRRQFDKRNETVRGQPVC